jgi:hypothetical protein
METGDTVVLSSYFSRRRGTGMLNRVKIWEAARATSAATSFFNPMNIDGEKFSDGGTGANNPINELWTEACDVWEDGENWKLEENLRCLVSIGTGIPRLAAFSDNPIEIGKALVSIALDTEKVADTFRKHHPTIFLDKRAFRFNVVQGLSNVGLEEVPRQGEILAVTRRYLQLEEVVSQMDECSHKLRERPNTESASSH